MTDQVQERIDSIRARAQAALDDDRTADDDWLAAGEVLWLIDQLTAARESIRDARAQEQEDQDVTRHLEAYPLHRWRWPRATPENSPSLTDHERKVANTILAREGQRIQPVIIAGSEGRHVTVYSEPEVADIMSRYFHDRATQ